MRRRSNRGAWHVTASLLLTVLAGACGGDPAGPRARTPSASASPTATPRPVHSPDPELPYEGDWGLVSGTSPRGSIPILEDFPVTLVLEGRGLSGRSPCNSYFGGYSITGTDVHPLRFAVQQADCPDNTALIAERRYLRSLQAAEKVYADATTLRLTAPDMELVFERLPPPQLDALVDVTWVAGRRTLRFSSDGTFRGTAGCNVITGKWSEEAGRIFTPVSRTKTGDDCPTYRYAGVEDFFTFAIDGDTLTITYEGKSRVFRRR
jgi:heat shock protein HslJ